MQHEQGDAVCFTYLSTRTVTWGFCEYSLAALCNPLKETYVICERIIVCFLEEKFAKDLSKDNVPQIFCSL